ncbi:MAG: glutamine synthetase III [Bacteroidota bacterium]|nr:glutamine synthetase III [Bacteroidota bacterium]MEC8361886.1 glutamine synthetase III [Bacteroidota bacterium]MEC8368027.1 glutamine synthetase III [Bacteroidota bacterium]
MSLNRQQALHEVLDRVPNHQPRPANKISEYFGENVFNLHVMRSYLPDEAYDGIVEAMEKGTPISRKVADQTASAMKEWAISRGATHYTHWFQPLTGSTAEKHDSFISPTADGRAIEKFDGTLLVQQEPDASSFPSGGIRNTFEARGYTLWDPTSPAFVWGETLCIPTIFISYTGYALDNKMPLLKALSAVDAAATSVCQYFDRNVTKVNATLGWEQEYFLVDKALYAARPDLAMTGRALFGAAPAKGQQLDDHYFGAIPERVSAFMKDFEMEAHKLGIPVTTRHNEVAPNQFELAPVFEEANLANDHNLLLMELLEKVARRHDFRILLHEKPFAGVNGSGKHNNWSLGTNTGVNLLKPGNNPKTNLRFLTFFVNTLAALHRHADVVRASIASVGNDHRLGANEAPPAIMSAFIGSQLSELLDALEASIKAGKLTPADKTALKLEIGRIPEVLLDNTDRNRTSPFAFTGNKFELRAAGSTANCAVPMTVLNTIVAEQLNAFKAAVDVRIKGGDKKDDALLKELQKLIKEHKAIRFEGNGYGDEWVKEAKKRGLSNLTDTPTALQVWGRKEVAELFSSLGVLTTEELHARQEVEYENYIMKRQIEARIAGDMATNIVLPAAIAYQNMLIENISGLMDVFGKDAKAMTVGQREVLAEVSECVSKLHKSASSLRSERSKINKMDDIAKRAVKYGSVVTPLIEEVGSHCARLEQLVDNEIWPLPKFQEMLFTR